MLSIDVASARRIKDQVLQARYSEFMCQVSTAIKQAAGQGLSEIQQAFPAAYRAGALAALRNRGFVVNLVSGDVYRIRWL